MSRRTGCLTADRSLPRLVLAVAAICTSAVVLATSIANAAPSRSSSAERAVAAPITLSAHSAAATTSDGFGPGQIRAAYALPARGARGQTVAIISAFDDPHLQSDLDAYDKRFGLPSCTTQNGCLRKLNQSGQSAPLPPTDLSGGQWITESAVGTETTHGICQSCRILLVEASTDTESDFSKAVSTAARAGATVIVSTFTGIETPDGDALSGDYLAPQASVIAAAGDPTVGQYGYDGNLNFPSVLPGVLAVGGTHLRLGTADRYAGESVWNGTVSGCSLYESAPAWQSRIASASDCGAERAVADLAAVADPGAIVHITGAGQPGGPWYVANGTSLSAPVIGAVIGLAGSMGSSEAQVLYERELSDPGAFHDIVTGANAPICRVSICKGARGWDGPTGLGTPAGLEAFLPAGPAVAVGHPRITIAARKRQLRASGRWRVSLELANGNAFRVSGSLVIRSTVRIAGHPRLVTFATARFTRASLASGSITLTIAGSARNLLRSRHALTVYAFASARGAVGRSRTVRTKLSLLAP